MKKLVPFLLIGLVGCQATAPRIVTTETVEVPIAVRCEVTYPAKPSKKTAKPEDSSYTKLKLLLTELEEYRWYSKQLEVAIQKCAKDISAAP